MAAAIPILPAVAASPGKLAGTWVLTRAGDHPVTPSETARVPYFTISGTTISGFDGCNQFSGNLHKPGLIRSTRRGCKAGYLKLPLDLSGPAAHLAMGKRDGGHLHLPARAGLPASEFIRK